MLRKKLQSLVAQANLDQLSNFEIIHDSSAIQIIGGEGCAVLTSCQNFTGGCASLTTCGTYNLG